MNLAGVSLNLARSFGQAVLVGGKTLADQWLFLLPLLQLGLGRFAEQSQPAPHAGLMNGGRGGRAPPAHNLSDQWAMFAIGRVIKQP